MKEETYYWDNRMMANGHTGWNDPVIYSFDQQIRISIVKDIIKNSKIESCLNLLDYGCGSGDFSFSLQDYFNQVWLYDISKIALEHASTRIKNNVIVKSLDDLKSFSSNFDVILSITVIQHILDDLELDKTLSILHDCLNDDGIFIVFESFFNKENSLQRGWDVQYFEDLVKNKKFKIEKKYNYYYPDNSNEQFRQFHNRIDVRIFQIIYRISDNLFIRKKIEKILQKIAIKYNSVIKNFYYQFSDEQGTKIYVLKKL